MQEETQHAKEHPLEEGGSIFQATASFQQTVVHFGELFLVCSERKSHGSDNAGILLLDSLNDLLETQDALKKFIITV